MSVMQFTNERDDFPKHFVISRAVAENCLDYLQGQMRNLKLDINIRDWLPLAISIALEFKNSGQLETYESKKDELEKSFASEGKIAEGRNRDIVTISAMQEESLSFILELAVSELGAEELVQNPKKAVDLLEKWCELGFIILKDIWQTPEYNSVEGFAKALSLAARGKTGDLLISMNM